MKRIILWGGMVVGLLAVLVLAAYLGSRSQNVEAKTLTVPVSDADWKNGPADAPATLVEYSDFQCPACTAFHSILDQELKDHGTKIRFVYRHFPLRTVHPNADLAARAAEAAGKQGKFWEMHNMLFEKHDEWAEKSNAEAQALFVSYAKALQLKEADFSRDIDSDIAKKKVNDDIAGGEGMGIRSTPTFFLNGKQMIFTTIGQFNDQINAAIK